MTKFKINLLVLIACIFLACNNSHSSDFVYHSTQEKETISLIELNDFQKKLVAATKSIIDPSIQYNPQYFTIPYPNGDVPSHVGVCTDVVIRSYRKIGIDLQKEVHEDMKQHFHLYPKKWGLTKTDRNIDHRRVPNLMTFFSRKGKVLPITNNASDYLPGDIVCWELNNGLTHIGIVIDEMNQNKTRYLVVHNIGGGQVAEDVLFSYKIIGHYRYQK